MRTAPVVGAVLLGAEHHVAKLLAREAARVPALVHGLQEPVLQPGDEGRTGIAAITRSISKPIIKI